jgi:hypothetical protein
MPFDLRLIGYQLPMENQSCTISGSAIRVFPAGQQDAILIEPNTNVPQ